MAENAYLALAQKGKNAFWRYLVTNLAIIVSAIAVQTVALILILILTGKMEAIIGSGNQLLDTLPPLIVLLLGMAPFPVALVILGLGLWLLHGRSPRTLLTVQPHFAWMRLLLSATIWLILLGLSDLVMGLFITPGNYQLTFDLRAWLPYAVAAVILIPIQASTEELLFRGYLMQSLGLLTRRSWFPLLVSTLVFTSLHGANTDVIAYGAPLMLGQIALMGLLMGWVTLRSKGLEAALGLHTANNLYGALLITYPASSLPSPAVFSMKTIDPVAGLVGLAVVSVIYLGLMRLLASD
jgi:membrane protease YdiL (CAAX protease family)